MRKNVANRREGTAQPRWGWSGVAPLAAIQLSTSDIDLEALLPGHRSPIEKIVLVLRDLGGRYHRYLHQDEFGPPRAERMSALRKLLDQLDLLSGQLHRLPRHFCLRLSKHLPLQGAVEADIDGYHAYRSDEQALSQLAEAAVDARRMLFATSAERDAELMNNLNGAAETALYRLYGIDTTTAGELVIDTEVLGLEIEKRDREWIAFSIACAHVGRLRRRAELTLDRLERRRGPERSVSANALVWELCDLYYRETGRAVTNSAVEHYYYTGTPQSPAGRFVLAAIELLHPSDARTRGPQSRVTPRQARALNRGRLRHAVYFAMRDYVAYHRRHDRHHRAE
jgi:hypothetical protein